MMISRHAGLLLLAVLLSACASGPDYKRPQTELPQDWNAPVEEATTLGEWWRHFDDPQLVGLIEESLVHNNELKIAVANVDAAAAALRLARADYLPNLNAQAGSSRARASDSAATPVPGGVTTEHSAGLLLDYEVDLWGRLRRANEAAMAGLQREVAVRDAVRAAVAATVARAYFETLALERQIALLERLHATRVDDLRLQKTRLDAGLISSYDHEQARSETAAIAARLPALRSARSRTLTALAVLRGASPRIMLAEWSESKTTDVAGAGLPVAPVVPLDLPSELLERRPDIRAAEQQLIAANARVGEAKAAYFPRLSLTGFLGSVAAASSGLFTSAAQAWQAGAALSLPLTDINRVGANVNAATALRDAVTADYARTVQLAFQETLDALTEVEAAREIMRAQDERVDALRNAYGAAQARYRAGSIGYLELLDVERQLRVVEQQQVSAQLALLHATVDLYRALGGGWQQGQMLASGD